MALQFDTAATHCAVCKKQVGEVYFVAGKAVVCAACKTRIESARPPRTSPLIVARAALCGVGGAVAGGLLYWLVLATTHAMISFIAIAVAYLVGRAMQFGSRGQRGLPFQIVAVVLTYCGIAFGYAFAPREVVLSASSFTLATIELILAGPVIETLAQLPYSLLSGLIVGIGLWYAWVMNRPVRLPVFNGPFKIGARA